MIIRPEWKIQRNKEGLIPANVPGNVQSDYAEFYGWGDVNYADNCTKYNNLEEDTWYYRAKFRTEHAADERVFFISGGIDYMYDIAVNGKTIYMHEGMFTDVNMDITDYLNNGINEIEIKIYPHPKSQDEPKNVKQADQSCKPTVEYGYDWHPRLLTSGIWNDAYLEVRGKDYIAQCDVSYEFMDGYVEVFFNIDDACVIELYSPGGELIYKGTDKKINIKDPLLWWCNGNGKANLYSYRVTKGESERCGNIGFRTVELVVGDDSIWAMQKALPMTRDMPPAQIRLNGKNVFAKGSNFVKTDIFMGNVTREIYESLIRLAAEANMNIFRKWGGAGIEKEEFYNLCDEYGIMIWQEFPLDGNNYQSDSHYLKILEQEARAIVRKLRRHPCIILWSGGNELFNSWSKMTDQSHALRLLNKVCYEEDRNTPFLPTSPIMGMSHGPYFFCDGDTEVYSFFDNAQSTAYNEFGVPSMPNPDYIKTFIPSDMLMPNPENSIWRLHHAFGAFGEEKWLCLDIIEKYFGKQSKLDNIARYSAWLQCEGYKALFEEARRQKPICSMALNWCFNEPWKTAANNSLISYPSKPKTAYYSVKNSLSPVVASAKLKKFSYIGGEKFTAELWLLNDTDESVKDEIYAYIVIGGDKIHLTDWKTPTSKPGGNIKGVEISVALPLAADVCYFEVVLESKGYAGNSYKLKYEKGVT